MMMTHLNSSATATINQIIDQLSIFVKDNTSNSLSIVSEHLSQKAELLHPSGNVCIRDDQKPEAWKSHILSILHAIISLETTLLLQPKEGLGVETSKMLISKIVYQTSLLTVYVDPDTHFTMTKPVAMGTILLK